MSSPEQELEKLKKQRAELVEQLDWLIKNYISAFGVSGLDDRTKEIITNGLRALKDIDELIAKQGGEVNDLQAEYRAEARKRLAHLGAYLQQCNMTHDELRADSEHAKMLDEFYRLERLIQKDKEQRG